MVIRPGPELLVLSCLHAVRRQIDLDDVVGPTSPHRLVVRHERGLAHPTSVDRPVPDRTASPNHHTADVLVDWQGQPATHGIEEHIEAMKAYVEQTGGRAPPQITSHPIKFGSGEWTCVIGEFENGARMVTVAKWRDGAIAEEYIWT